jgi:hypothetical protein
MDSHNQIDTLIDTRVSFHQSTKLPICPYGGNKHLYSLSIQSQLRILSQTTVKDFEELHNTSFYRKLYLVERDAFFESKSKEQFNIGCLEEAFYYSETQLDHMIRHYKMSIGKNTRLVIFLCNYRNGFYNLIQKWVVKVGKKFALNYIDLLEDLTKLIVVVFRYEHDLRRYNSTIWRTHVCHVFNRAKFRGSNIQIIQDTLVNFCGPSKPLYFWPSYRQYSSHARSMKGFDGILCHAPQGQILKHIRVNSTMQYYNIDETFEDNTSCLVNEKGGFNAYTRNYKTYRLHLVEGHPKYTNYGISFEESFKNICTEKNNRTLPIHNEAKNGLKWHDGMETIIMTFPRILAIPSKSGLLPIILAAASDFDNLCTVYHMLIIMSVCDLLSTNQV